MVIAGIEFPDDCPKGCAYWDDFMKYGQNAMCSACPVFNVPDLVSPEDYRVDWARSWKKFFDTGEEPYLTVEVKE